MTRKIVLAALVFAGTAAFAMSIGEVNKASKEELMQIKGIGEAKADAIVKARKKHKFKSFDELQEVKGVGPALTQNIKKDVKVKEPARDKKSKKKHSKKEKSH